MICTRAPFTAAGVYFPDSAGTSFSLSYTIPLYSLVPSQNPVPASKSLGARNASIVFTVVILLVESRGTNMVKRTRIPRIMLPATEALFLRKRFMASLKKVVGFVSSFLSVTLLFC